MTKPNPIRPTRIHTRRYLSWLLRLGVVALTCVVGPAATSGEPERPNIIFVMVDDLGYGDIGAFWQNQRSEGPRFETPGLDRMVADGARLTHHYTSAPVCAPARASFMLGQHQGHASLRDNHFDQAIENGHTVASVLREAGYRTVHVGKGGISGRKHSVDTLEGEGSRDLEAHPLDRGFDRFFGYLFHVDGHEHYPRNGETNKNAFIYDDFERIEDAYVDLYSPDAWTAFAKETIIRETRNNPDRPFFLYVAYDTPHFNMQFPPTAEYPDGRGLSGGIQWTGGPAYANTAVNDPAKIDSVQGRHPDVDPNWPVSNQQHVSMVRRIDDSMADIRRTVEDLGIEENTIVIFTSDNGPHREGHDPRFFESYADMEGVKRDFWEAGIRVPTIVWGPGWIPEGKAASHPSDFSDWMPTFAEWGGVSCPASSDGVSLAPVLTGEGTQREKDFLYFEYDRTGNRGHTPDWDVFPNHGGEVRGQMQAIRVGDLMGVRTGIESAEDEFRIYNVVTDPAQGNDLASERPDVQQLMKYLALTSRRPRADAERPYDNVALPAVAPFSVVKGLDRNVFEKELPWIPEFRDLEPATTGTVARPEPLEAEREGTVGVAFQGYLLVGESGEYTFHLTSDTGGVFFLHEARLIDDDFGRAPGVSTVASDTVRLKAGLHPLRLYSRHDDRERTLRLEWRGPGREREVIPAEAFVRER